MKQSTFYYLLRRGVIGCGGSIGGGSFTGLLDTYSGAAAAYSLRQLSSAYSGDAIVVRRASDNTTQNIGFVNNELDTASLESFCSGTDGFVTTWYDQSGNGLDVAQSTASQQPQIISSGSTITEGTKPTLSFDNDGLLNTSAFVSGSQNRTIVSVAKMTESEAYLYGFGDNGTTQRVSIRKRTNYRIEISGTGEESNIPTGSHDLQFLYLDGTTFGDLNLSVNGGTTYNFTGTQTLNTDNGLLIGSGGTDISSSYGGTLQELIVYGSNEASNKSGIETNINDFYSIY